MRSCNYRKTDDKWTHCWPVGSSVLNVSGMAGLRYCKVSVAGLVVTRNGVFSLFKFSPLTTAVILELFPFGQRNTAELHYSLATHCGFEDGCLLGLLRHQMWLLRYQQSDKRFFTFRSRIPNWRWERDCEVRAYMAGRTWTFRACF
jgi:hypothetical protein